jgi:hypothetical protein
MAKIELTVEQHYVDWGLAEAVREFMQNGLDAQADGHPFTVTYDEHKESLLFVSEGASLTTRTLLLGSTSKRGRVDQIGKFGEGYKLALLALVNAGHPVVLRTGDERWVPSVAPSMNFGGANVLVISTLKRPMQDLNAVSIEVGGVKKEDWQEIRLRFLVLEPPVKSAGSLETGRILFDDAHAGRIFAGGIFVEKIDGFRYGYDLPPRLAPLDRDRRMVDRYQAEWVIAQIWGAVCEKEPQHLEAFMALLGLGAPDVRAAKYSGTTATSVKKALAARFRERFGEKAIPVGSEEEGDQARSIGRRGVVVPPELREILTPETGNLATARDELRRQVATEVVIEDLTAAEAQAWARAVTLVSRVRPHLRLAQFRVVVFPSPDILGLYKAEPDKDAEIEIARSTLGEFKRVLTTIVHEVAHDTTGGAPDASIDFERALQALWADIVESLANAS